MSTGIFKFIYLFSIRYNLTNTAKGFISSGESSILTILYQTGPT